MLLLFRDSYQVTLHTQNAGRAWTGFLLEKELVDRDGG
jgi:hypothetical protein